MARIIEIDVRTASKKDLIKYIQSEGKRANTALVALENAKLEKQSFAYQYLSSKKTKFVTTTKSGHMKIKLDTRGKNRGELMSIASTIQGFRTAKTSTVGQTKTWYKKSFESLKEKQNLNINQEQWADITETMGFNSFMSQFGSEELIEIIRTHENPRDIITMLEATGQIKTIGQAKKVLDKVEILRETDFTDSQTMSMLDRGIKKEIIIENKNLTVKQIIERFG